VQGHHSGYYGFGILSETAVGVGASYRYISPYLDLPSGSVLVASTFADGTSGVQSIAFGGTPNNTRGTTSSVEATNQLSWFSENNRHRVKLASEIRREAYTVDQSTNLRGTFAFNSLADLQGARSASYTRSLNHVGASGSEL